jgi:hypothetical protein
MSPTTGRNETMTNVRIKFGGETVTMSWNGGEASAPIQVDGEEIGHRSADARHRTALAVALACRHRWPEADWPTIPATGPVSDDWCDGSDAWAEVAYETEES